MKVVVDHKDLMPVSDVGLTSACALTFAELSSIVRTIATSFAETAVIRGVSSLYGISHVTSLDSMAHLQHHELQCWHHDLSAASLFQ